MSIYQEEMMRKLPRFGCTGTLNENTGSLTIRYNGVYLGRQLADGTLLYTDDTQCPCTDSFLVRSAFVRKANTYC